MAASSDTQTSLQALLDAIASGDTQRFNEMVRQFDLEFGEKKREFNTGATEGGRQFDVNQNTKSREDYASLASDLLKTASSLRGPQDYFQYQKMLSGGRDIFQQLYGNQPRPAFSQPTGQITPTSLTDVMNQLGFTKVPETPTHFWDPVTQKWFQQPTPPVDTSAAPTSAPPPVTSSGSASPKNTNYGSPPVFDSGGRVNGPPGSHILAILQAGEKVVPIKKSSNKGPSRDARTNLPVFDLGGIVPTPGAWNGRGFNPGSVPTGEYTNLFDRGGASPKSPASGGPTLKHGPVTIGSPGINFDPFTGARLAAGASGVKNVLPPAMVASKEPSLSGNVPLPYQINPAVWDSLGKTGQALALSAASAAGWDANDYVDQINAQRPQGVAPSSSIYDYYKPGSTKSGSEGMYGAY